MKYSRRFVPFWKRGDPGRAPWRGDARPMTTERLGRLQDWAYVVLDLCDEIECLRKLVPEGA